MNNQANANPLPHIRFQFESKYPNLEEVWMDGYRMAGQDLAEDDNPHAEGTLEHQHWNEGWWAGFYEEAPLYDIQYEENVSANADLTKVKPLEAANEASYKKPEFKRWLGRVAKIAGALAVTYAAYELLDVAA
jgi:hypothetical protein